MPIDVRWDTVHDGYAAFIGERKFAVFTVRQIVQNPNVDNLTGAQVMAWQRGGLYPTEVMDHGSWTVHFCSPSMKVEELQAVLDSLLKLHPTGQV